MKSKILLFFLLGGFLISCGNKATVTEATAPAEEFFFNPIIAGFNPDPSICAVGEDFYLVNSSFGYFPGLPILHSKDLVHWNQIGAAITREEQMDFTNQGISRGLFAPAISYHDGWFYIICTLIDEGGNFIVKSQNPAGPYSNPYWLPELNGGIDPSLFFDDNGKAYAIYNSVAPDNAPIYGGHRTIRMYEFNVDSMQVTGEEHLIVNGGTDITKNPVWIEGPHIYKKDNFYYLLCAEGGTGENHSEVVFRSEAVVGPYVPYEQNPILTQRDMDPNRPHPITSTGHADLVQTPTGEWWAVFLACRPYADNHYNTGRETFLAPVIWEDGWPLINPDFEEVQLQYPVPDINKTTIAQQPLSGNFVMHDDFKGTPDPRWLQLRTPKEKWFQFDTINGQLDMQLRSTIIAETGNPSLLLKRQPHLNGSATTKITFEAKTSNELAGLVVLQNENHYYFLAKTLNQILLLKKTAMAYDTLAKVNSYTNAELYLQVVAEAESYHFRYSEDGADFVTLAANIPANYISTKTAGGFVGCMYGLYASSNQTETSNVAVFDYFSIETNEEYYKLKE